MRSFLLWSVLASSVVVPVASPARAACDVEVGRLRQQAAGLADPAAHAHFIALVHAAERQMMEGYDDACLQAVEAADAALHAGTEQAPVSTAPPPAPAAPPSRDPGPAPELHGTVIGPSTRIAMFAGRDGTLVQAREGDPVGGFVVQAIRPAEADVIGGGIVRTLRVGPGGDAPVPVAEAPAPPPRAHVQGSDQHVE